MIRRYLEAGKIVNTHGVRGELKIQPWADSADFLKGFSVFYIDGKPFHVRASFVHKGALIAAFTGIDTLEDAELLRNKIINIDRNDAKLEDGAYFLQDIMGLQAVDISNGQKLGVIQEVLNLPTQDILVIKGQREIMLPRVPEFIKQVDLEAGVVYVRMIEGL